MVFLSRLSPLGLFLRFLADTRRVATHKDTAVKQDKQNSNLFYKKELLAQITDNTTHNNRRLQAKNVKTTYKNRTLSS